MSLEVRTAVARATRGVIPLWPLSSFIATNPLGAKESEVFGAVAPIRSRALFLADYAAGRITDADLVAAALLHVPELAGARQVTVGGRQFTAAELAVSELVHGGEEWVSASPSAPALDFVDEIVAKWVAAYLDPHPAWGMPDRSRGLWPAWSAMARFDPALPAAAKRRLRNLPEMADEALGDGLRRLGIDESQTDQVLRREVQHLPGWVAHIKWRSDHVGDIDLTSYFAIRVTLRWALGLRFDSEITPPEVTAAMTAAADLASVAERARALVAMLAPHDRSTESFGQVARALALHPPQLHPLTWQSAYEEQYRRQLIGGIGSTGPTVVRPNVQVVMCIDPRSEGPRRHLEVDGQVETFGFAGFFGIPIRFANYGARGAIDALPALLAARHSVTEVTHDSGGARRRLSALRVRDAFAAGLHASETSPAAPFALAETLGWFLGAGTLVRTLFPRLAGATHRMLERTVPTIPTSVTISDAFTLEERAVMAETAIRMMGLDRTAPLVVFAGHGSTSSNNLYQSALDCGACGGNPGAANARAAAAIFNDPDVRVELARRGLVMSDDTFFVAGEHNTVSDHIEILDPHLIPESHARAVAAFRAAQSRAGDLLVAERASILPGAASHSVARVRGRANDWAEVYPELGLAGNAAMIIGPREMTRGMNLGRRVFLHSYRPELDPDSIALETIMTAPLVVAQWINHQYYFSTVQKERWGAGTKTIHNAIGSLGVIAGHAGDLMVGLPVQSVAVGETDLHEPMRLTVVIQAPIDRVGSIISRNQVLRHLFDNEWISLVARDDQHGRWHRYGPYGFTPTTTYQPQR